MGDCEEATPQSAVVRIVILPSAMEDLEEGRRFYELQQSGLGVYFLETLFFGHRIFEIVWRRAPEGVWSSPCSIQAIPLPYLLQQGVRSGDCQSSAGLPQRSRMDQAKVRATLISAAGVSLYQRRSFAEKRSHCYANNLSATVPKTSVRRKSRPWKR